MPAPLTDRRRVEIPPSSTVGSTAIRSSVAWFGVTGAPVAAAASGVASSKHDHKWTFHGRSPRPLGRQQRRNNEGRAVFQIGHGADPDLKREFHQQNVKVC